MSLGSDEGYADHPNAIAASNAAYRILILSAAGNTRMPTISIAVKKTHI